MVTIKPIPLDKWNIYHKLIYNKPSNNSLSNLYDNLDDTFNLTNKINYALSIFRELNIPINLSSGLKYQSLCQKFLIKNKY